MENDRFTKIEKDQVLAGLIRKQKGESRFEKLETQEDSGQWSVASDQQKQKKNQDDDGKKYFACPKCNRNNPDGSLYCIYCGYVFPDVAEATDSGLKPYEIKCPGCGKVCNRNQKNCLWCGYHFVPTDDDIIKEGAPVEIAVHGHKFTSGDPYLPAYVKEAMVKIKKERLSPEGVENVVNDIKIRQAEAKLTVSGHIDKSRYKVIGFSMLGAGGIFLFLFRAFARPNFNPWLYLLAVIGGVLSMAGLLTAAMGMTPGEIDELREYRH